MLLTHCFIQVEYLETQYGPTKCYKAVESDTSKGMQECTSNNLVEGDVFTLKCNGPQGYPYPKTTWWKNDVAITQSNNGLDPTIDASGTLGDKQYLPFFIILLYYMAFYLIY